MKALHPSREPAIWIGLAGSILTQIVLSGAFPDLTANQAVALDLISIAVGIATRFFVSPAKPAA